MRTLSEIAKELNEIAASGDIEHYPTGTSARLGRICIDLIEIINRIEFGKDTNK